MREAELFPVVRRGITARDPYVTHITPEASRLGLQRAAHR